MTRATSALRAPTAAAIARVPDLPIGAVVVHRATWKGYGLWWFASRTDNPDPGRFDLETPHGTCYFADDPVGALIEKLAEPDELSPVVTVETVHRLRVHSGTLRHPATVADATDRRSRVPKELGIVTPYTLPWAWADALHADGRGGIVAWLRLDPAASRGVAVFGPAGALDSDDPQWTALDGVSPGADHLDALRAMFDIVVEPVPRRAEVEIAEPPG